MPKHVFISYAHKDEEYAARLYASLRERNIPAWRDSRIDYGDEWPDVIEEHLKSSAAVILVMSRHSKLSKWVKRENHYADRKGLPVMPLLLSGEPWLEVETSQYADVKGGRLPPEDFYRRLGELAGVEGSASTTGTVDALAPQVTSAVTQSASERFRQSYQDWASSIDPDLEDLAMSAVFTAVGFVAATIVGLLLVPWLASLLGELSFSEGWQEAVAKWSGWLIATPLLLVVVGFVTTYYDHFRTIPPIGLGGLATPWVIALGVAVLELWLFPDLSTFVTVTSKTGAMGVGVLGALLFD